MFNRTLAGFFAPALLAFGLLLAGCSEDGATVKVGSKNFAESNILSHMIAILAKDQGLNWEEFYEGLKENNQLHVEVY